MEEKVSEIVEVLQKNRSHPRLMEETSRLIYRMPFYGEFLLSVNFHEAKDKDQIPTAGVNVTARGMNFYWNRDFIEKGLENSKQVTFLLVHELYHLLFDHPKRTHYRFLDPKLSNVVQDMIINQIIMDKFPNDQVELPKEGGLLIPKEYNGDWVFEKLYDWLMKKKEERDEQDKKNGKPKQQPGQQKGQSQGGGGSQQGGNQPQSGGGGGSDSKEKEEDQKDSRGNPLYGPYAKNDRKAMSLDGILDRMQNGGTFFDVHINNEVPDELKKQIVNDLKNSLRARGLVSAHVEEVLNGLQKSKKDYLREIKRSIVLIKGVKKNPSYKKPNRRNIFGLRGKVRVGSALNVILDTSGSMHGYFEKALSCIFQNGIKIRLIQCDAEVHCTENIGSKNELKKVRIEGLGGTQLQPAIDEVVSKYNNINTVILTDGYTDTLNLSHLRGRVLILSVDRECPISRSNGKMKQIVIEDPDGPENKRR